MGQPPGIAGKSTASPQAEGEPRYDGRGSRTTRFTPLTPEEKIERIRQLAENRAKGRASTIQAEAAMIHAPLDNLNRYRRAEWEVVCRYLADPNLSVREIAKIMGYKDWRAVQKLLHRPRVVSLLKEIRAKQVEAVIKGDFGATALLKQSQTKAAKKVVDTIDDDGAGKKLNLEAAKDVLDRTGLGKQTAVEHHHVHEILRHFTPDELDRYGKTGEPPARFVEVFRQLEGPQGDPE